MGFSPRWINRIMNCVESVRYSVLLNGSPQEEFKPLRGIRQGDPLSPYLFLLCVEGLSTLLKGEESQNYISSIRINDHCPTLTHLIFADDSLIFFKASKEEAVRVKGVLETYEKASDQKINLEKSVFMTSQNTDDSRAEEINTILGVKRSKCLGLYLGLPT